MLRNAMLRKGTERKQKEILDFYGDFWGESLKKNDLLINRKVDSWDAPPK